MRIPGLELVINATIFYTENKAGPYRYPRYGADLELYFASIPSKT